MSRCAPRVLPVPASLQLTHDANPNAFRNGMAAALDGWGYDECPYARASARRAWAAGWMALKENWADTLDITGGRDDD